MFEDLNEIFPDTYISIFNYGNYRKIYIQIKSDRSFDLFKFILDIKEEFRITYGFKIKCIKIFSALYYGNFGIHPSLLLTNLASNKKISRLKWSKDFLKVTEGKIRDVFPESIINESQINYKLSSGNKFIDIVSGNPVLGEISRIYDNCYFWKVKSQNLKKTRSIFYNENIVI